MTEKIALAVISSIVPTLTVLLTFWRTRRKARQIHDIVNGNHTAALARIDALEKALKREKDTPRSGRPVT